MLQKRNDLETLVTVVNVWWEMVIPLPESSVLLPKCSICMQKITVEIFRGEFMGIVRVVPNGNVGIKNSVWRGFVLLLIQINIFAKGLAELFVKRDTFVFVKYITFVFFPGSFSAKGAVRIWDP